MRKAAAAVDLIAVLLFVAIGRAAHSHGVSLTGMATTAWPFLAGLAVGWLAIVGRGLDGTSIPAGLVAWISTVGLGMCLRVLAGQGIAFAFVLVALAFLGSVMLGARLVVAGARLKATGGGPSRPARRRP